MFKFAFLFTASFFLANVWLSGNSLVITIQPQTSGKAFELQLDKLDRKETNVVLMDESGVTFFSKTITNIDKWVGKMSFKKVPAQDYFLYIANQEEQHLQVITVTDDKLVFFKNPAKLDSKEKEGTFKVVAPKNGERKEIALAHLQGQSIHVKVLTLNGASVLDKSISTRAGYGQVIKFEDVVPGGYILIVENNESKFAQLVALDADRIEFIGSAQFGAHKTIATPIAGL